MLVPGNIQQNGVKNTLESTIQRVPLQHSAMDRQSQTCLHQSQADRHRGGALRPL